MTMGASGCASNAGESSGSTSDRSSSSGSSSSGASANSSDDETAFDDSDAATDEETDSVGSNSEPNGDGLSGDELAANISRQYQAQWEEFFGMPMEDADAPVRCDALEAEEGATTECEVKMAEGVWMPLDVEVTTVTPVGIEYSVTPNLYG